MVSLTIMDFKTKDLLILLTSWRTLYDPNNNQFNSDPRQDPHDRSLYIWNQQRQDLRSSKPCLPAQLPYELQFHLRSISMFIIVKHIISNNCLTPIVYFSSCGKPSSSGFNQLSFNGERVSKGQFPWIVPLFDQTQAQTPSYFCGSTIISNRHLITAAHCIYDAGDFMTAERILAIPGMYNIDNFVDENANLMYISSVHPHEDYINDDDFNDADIAILRLKTVLIYTEFIIPICLWNDANDLERVVDQEGIVAGWGLTEKGSSTVPTYIKATIVTQRSCRDNLEKMLPIISRVFCGDGHGSAPCNGDSGSGFVLKRGNQFYLRGVVSKGQQDPETLLCNVKKFAIYTDVAKFRYWIKTIMS